MGGVEIIFGGEQYLLLHFHYFIPVETANTKYNSVSFMTFFRECECIRNYQLLIPSSSLKRSFRKTSLRALIKTTVVLTALLAASIFQTTIVIVVMKILEKYLFEKFNFRNQFLETLSKYTSPEERNSDKLKYGVASMLQGQVFLKGGRRGLEPSSFNFFKGWSLYLIFSKFIIFPFRNYFILSTIL